MRCGPTRRTDQREAEMAKLPKRRPGTRRFPEFHRANDKHPIPICSTRLPPRQLVAVVCTSWPCRLSVVRRTDVFVGSNPTSPASDSGCWLTPAGQLVEFNSLRRRNGLANRDDEIIDGDELLHAALPRDKLLRSGGVPGRADARIGKNRSVWQSRITGSEVTQTRCTKASLKWETWSGEDQGPGEVPPLARGTGASHH